jgi:PPK2 family polyphosphate:nucleotide phosphotransferase
MAPIIQTMQIDSPYLVPFDGSFDIANASMNPPEDAPDRKSCRKALKKSIGDLRELQEALYAEDRRSLLLVFQAMDAAGKDGTIRATTSGVNPAGFQVFSFKAPSKEELDHDFMWRLNRALPERGRIGIFNRSHYEEVLVLRVHPEYLGSQRIDVPNDLGDLWTERFASICDWEKHLAQNGTDIVKFFLHVSPDEQARRFLRRLDTPAKNYKFSANDVAQRDHWESYMNAYEETLNATSREHAPWYAIPADDKPFMRMTVADIIIRKLKAMNLKYPELPQNERNKMATVREKLQDELGE